MAETARSGADELRLCLSSPHAYPLFDPRDDSPMGGAETHAWLLARGFAEQPGCSVDFVVRAPIRFDRRQFGQVTVWNVGDGLDRERAAWVKFRTATFSDRRRALGTVGRALPRLALAKFRRGGRPPADPIPRLTQLAADGYCCFGVSRAALAVCRAAHAVSRPVALFLESDNDLDERFRPDSTYVTPNGERAADCAAVLQEADAIIAQSDRQQADLEQRFARTASVLPNPFDFDSWCEHSRLPSPTVQQLGLSRFVLWIGRADEHHKRPRLLLDLARRLPAVQFLMVLNPFDDAVERAIRAAAPPNVAIVDRIPYREMAAVFSAACGYVSTGSRAYEGAPHVFLQAAASGVPIASLEVDGDILRHVAAGANALGNFEQLTENVQHVWANDAVCRQWCLQGRDFVRQRYGLTEVCRLALAVIRAAIVACEEGDCGKTRPQ